MLNGMVGDGLDRTRQCILSSTRNSLLAASKSHKPGKFNGIPCEVPVVRLLERHWYSVQFYTNEFWGRRNALNCSSGLD